MRRQIILATIAAVFMIIIAGEAVAGDVRSITGAELEAMMSGKEPIVIVDVREPGIYTMGHIRGAVSMPYESAHKRILKELSPMDSIVFVCHSGPMGDELGAILAEKGYPRIFSLIGGMKKWTGHVTTGKQAP